MANVGDAGAKEGLQKGAHNIIMLKTICSIVVLMGRPVRIDRDTAPNPQLLPLLPTSVSESAMYDTELPVEVLSWMVLLLPGNALTSCTFERSTTPRGLTDSTHMHIIHNTLLRSNSHFEFIF